MNKRTFAAILVILLLVIVAISIYFFQLVFQKKTVSAAEQFVMSATIELITKNGKKSDKLSANYILQLNDISKTNSPSAIMLNNETKMYRFDGNKRTEISIEQLKPQQKAKIWYELASEQEGVAREVYLLNTQAEQSPMRGALPFAESVFDMPGLIRKEQEVRTVRAKIIDLIEKENSSEDERNIEGLLADAVLKAKTANNTAVYDFVLTKRDTRVIRAAGSDVQELLSLEDLQLGIDIIVQFIEPAENLKAVLQIEIVAAGESDGQQ